MTLLTIETLLSTWFLRLFVISLLLIFSWFFAQLFENLSYGGRLCQLVLLPLLMKSDLIRELLHFRVLAIARSLLAAALRE